MRSCRRDNLAECRRQFKRREVLGMPGVAWPDPLVDGLVNAVRCAPCAWPKANPTYANVPLEDQARDSRQDQTTGRR